MAVSRTLRPDFWELVDYATAHHVGVKFSTNGVRITPEVAARLATNDYVDVQISLDGATAEVNDDVRGAGSFATAVQAMENLAAAGFRGFKLSVVCTRENLGQLDDFKAIADRYGAQLRLTRLRPRVAARTSGTSSTRRLDSSANCTSGSSPMAKTCSPATPSSTWPATASRCRA